MKKYLLWVICALCVFCIDGNAQQLRFHNGEFKILQLTDIHYIHGKDKSAAAIDCIHKTIEAEKPDLIVITGDLIYGAKNEPRCGRESMTDVMAAVSSHKIPFCTTFGNHDDEQGLTRSELYDIISATPYCVNPSRGEAASPDYAVQIASADGQKTAAVIYCFDSNAYSPFKDVVPGYNWIKFDQIGWYREQSKAFTKANAGTPVPSLAFFHIPLNEFYQAAEDHTTKIVGYRMEAGGNPKVNSGLFVNMLEMGDMLGVFAGHDHDSDYVVNYYGICLGYGRFSGCSNVYNHLPNGGRVIILKEGERNFDTYVRLRTGEIEQKVSFPLTLSKRPNVN